MAQELYSKALAGICTLDKPGNIRDGVTKKIPEVWIKGCERIVTHFCRSIGKSVQKRRLARIWKPDKADIRKKLELNDEISPLAFGARPPLARRGIGRTFEVFVAESPITPAKKHNFLPLSK